MSLVAESICSFISIAFSGKIVKYEWDFDKDGKIDATGKVVDHVFSSAGDHPVTLKVTDDKGATDSRTRTVSVLRNSLARKKYPYEVRS